jgi:hypothetical protein
LEDLKGVGTAPLTAEDREELERLRRDQVKLKARLQVKGKHEKEADSDNSDDSEVKFNILIVTKG